MVLIFWKTRIIFDILQKPGLFLIFFQKPGLFFIFCKTRIAFNILQKNRSFFKFCKNPDYYSPAVREHWWKRWQPLNRNTVLCKVSNYSHFSHLCILISRNNHNILHLQYSINFFQIFVNNRRALSNKQIWLSKTARQWNLLYNRVALSHLSFITPDCS